MRKDTLNFSIPAASDYSPISFLETTEQLYNSRALSVRAIKEGAPDYIKSHPSDTVVAEALDLLGSFPKGWVRSSDIDTLMTLIYSKRKSACYLNSPSSFIPAGNFAETGGYAAIFVDAYRKDEKVDLGLYACPKVDSALNKELIAWWATAGKEK